MTEVLTRVFHGPRPPIICLCGSTRFITTWNAHRRRLTYDGYIVLAIEVLTTQAAGDDPQHTNPGRKSQLDELHKRKIDLADEVLVLNVGGCTGHCTRSEIAYARATGKLVRFLQPEHPA